MQFSISREVLLKLLRVVAGVVERRAQQNPVLSNVLLKLHDNQISMVATDQEVEVVALEPLDSIGVAGEITVPFRKLYDICKALPDIAVLDLVLQDGKMVIKSGRSRFVLATLPAEQFPDVQQLVIANSLCSFIIGTKQFRNLVERTAFAMAEQDVRYFLNGMLLEVKNYHLYAVAADGHRLALNYIDLPGCSAAVSVIVPRKGILEIMRILGEQEGEFLVRMSASHIQVQCGGITVTSKLLHGKFPDYERVIPRDGDKVVVGNRELLKEAFYRASVLFSEKFKGVRLRMSASRLMVMASNPEQDQVEEDLEIDYDGKEIEVGFNVRYLLDFLSVIHSDMVRFTFSDSNKSTLIEEVGEGASGAYVLMPIRT